MSCKHPFRYRSVTAVQAVNPQFGRDHLHVSLQVIVPAARANSRSVFFMDARAGGSLHQTDHGGAANEEKATHCTGMRLFSRCLFAQKPLP
jgi:hypothetical protein